jgi:hypothetical protein
MRPTHIRRRNSTPDAGVFFVLFFSALCFLSSKFFFVLELLFLQECVNESFGGLAFVGTVHGYPEVLAHGLIFSSFAYRGYQMFCPATGHGVFWKVSSSSDFSGAEIAMMLHFILV